MCHRGSQWHGLVSDMRILVVSSNLNHRITQSQAGKDHQDHRVQPSRPGCEQDGAIRAQLAGGGCPRASIGQLGDRGRCGPALPRCCSLCISAGGWGAALGSVQLAFGRGECCGEFFQELLLLRNAVFGVELVV